MLRHNQKSEELLHVIDKVACNKDLPDLYKEEVIKSIIYAAIENHVLMMKKTETIPFWTESQSRKILNSILKKSTFDIVKKVENKMLTKGVPTEDHDVSIINSHIRDAITSDKHIRLLTKLTKKNINKLGEKYLFQSSFEGEKKHKELSDDAEKHEDDVKKAVFGLSFR